MKIKETKEKIIESLEDENRQMPFKIEVVGHSDNCSINKTEEELIQNNISKILVNMGINNFDIIIKC